MGKISFLHEYLSRSADIVRILRRPRYSQAEILNYQNRRLRRTLDAAYRDVPHYRTLFDKAGIKPGDIRSVSDLAVVPLTNKKDLRKHNLDHYLSSKADTARLKSFGTTGSTGIPLNLRRTPAEDFLFHLFRWRTIRAYGLRAGDHVIRIRSGEFGHRPLSWRISQAMGFYRQSIIDSRETPQKNARDLLSLRPDVLTGYNSSIARIARIIVFDLKTTLPLRLAVGGADMLTPLLRKQIREAFQTTIYDNYECQEAGMLAWECPATGLYHISDDNVVFEVVGEDGSPARENEPGVVVITSLHLHAMPFIRYKLDDIVTPGPARCPCGAPYRTLKAIEAKRQDYFRLPGGREIYPWTLSVLLIEIAPWILQFQLVQERTDRIVMRAEAVGNPEPGVLDAVKEKIGALLDPGVEFDIEIVPDLGTWPGGKFWVRRSLVNSMYDPE